MSHPQDMAAVLRHTREKIERLVPLQCTEPADRNYGGFLLDETGYADSRNSIYEGMHLIAGYLCPEVAEDLPAGLLLARVRMFLDFMRRRQRKNGIVMLGASAAPSCAEVGFTIPAVCYALRRLRQIGIGDVEGGGDIAAGLERYLHNAATALRELPPLTSNHRWTACAGPLALLDTLYPDPRNRAVIDKFLADGVDIDGDGLYYEERSPNYNMVANMGLLYLADALGRREFLELAARKARLHLRLLQPSGELDTSFSFRQDRGLPGVRDFGCFYIYRRLACEFSDPEFHAAADILREMLTAHSTPLVPHILLVPLLAPCNNGAPRQAPATEFDLKFRQTTLWRWRRGEVAATVCADRGGHWWEHTYGGWGAPARGNNLLSYHFRDAIIDGLKLLWGCGSGSLRPQEITYTGEGRALLAAEDYGADHIAHYRPSCERTRLPLDMRGRVELTRLVDDGMELAVGLDGEEDCPVNLKLLLRAGSVLRAEDGEAFALTAGGSHFCRGGDYVLESPQGNCLRISGLPPSAHQLIIGESHAITGYAEKNGFSLLCGAFTPLHCRIRLIPLR